ncbi:MAG: hypothetical protein ACLR4A_00880 [Christensenellales bacterium]
MADQRIALYHAPPSAGNGARAYLKGRKFTRHQQKVVDAVFDRIREEDEKAHEGQAEEQL